MNKSESITNLIAATIKVMEAVKGIEKSLTVGSGNNTYKGVADQEVKKEIGGAMAANGLSIFPIAIEENTQLSEWEEKGGQYGDKRKQSIFTKVKTTYLLIHTSGEFIELTGYGHGVDSQDKSAGKATTYALKYCLLYTFLVPTGKIDDADATHSDEYGHPVPPKQQPPKGESRSRTVAPPRQEKQNTNTPPPKDPSPAEIKKTLSDDAVNKAAERMRAGETNLLQQIFDKYDLTDIQKEVLRMAAKAAVNPQGNEPK